MSIARARLRNVTELIPAPLTESRRVVFVESIVIVVLTWQFLYMVWPAYASAFTSPILVAEAFYELVATKSDDLQTHLWATLRHVAYGFGVTVLLGTLLGLALGWSDYWERAFSDYLTIGLAMPSLFAAIFAAMWFGIGDTTPMVASVIIAFPFLAVNVYEGVKTLDNSLIQMSRSFDLSTQRTIRHLIIPAILPSWFAGLRYAVALSWKISNLAEFIASGEGIGFMIRYHMEHLRLTEMMAWVLFFIGFILFIEYVVFAQLEKRLFEWRDEVSIGWA